MKIDDKNKSMLNVDKRQLGSFYMQDTFSHRTDSVGGKVCGGKPYPLYNGLIGSYTRF